MKDIALSPDGVPIHFEAHGEGAPALVFVHGWCCDRSYWEGQLGPFARDHRVVALDMAGHGESGKDRQQWSIPAFGGDVASVVGRLGLGQVVLIGHSMGGPVIVEAARQLPGRVLALVGVDTFRNLGHVRTPDEVDRTLAPFRTDFAAAAEKYVRAMFIPASDPALVQRIVSRMSATPPEVAIGAMEANHGNDRNLTAALRGLDVPVATINAGDRPNDIAAAEGYGIRVVTMSGVGHFVMMEDTETFNRLLGETVDGLVQARAGE